MKIWAKLIIDGKNTKDILYENSENLNYDTYEIMLREIAYQLDIPTPLTLRTNYKDLIKFYINKINKKLFVEDIHFDYLELEFYE